jgi:hypothetical protein
MLKNLWTILSAQNLLLEPISKFDAKDPLDKVYVMI